MLTGRAFAGLAEQMGAEVSEGDSDQAGSQSTARKTWECRGLGREEAPQKNTGLSQVAVSAVLGRPSFWTPFPSWVPHGAHIRTERGL